MYDQAAIAAVPAGAASAAFFAPVQAAIGLGALLAVVFVLAVLSAVRSHRLDTH